MAGRRLDGRAHYVDLTDFFAEHKVAEIMAPATVDAYAEYDGKYWAIPAEGDATGWAYRKDWFEDPAEMAAFKEKYGYDLATPKTWAELRDIAEFFHRPDEGRYGVAIYTDNSYDALVMGYENALFSYGGDLGDYSTYQVDRNRQLRGRRWRRSRCTASSTPLPRRTGVRPSSRRTTRRSPRAWRR